MHENTNWYKCPNISNTNPKGTPFQAYLKAVSFPNHALICDQNIEELRRIFNKKFPKRIDASSAFSQSRLNIWV